MNEIVKLLTENPNVYFATVGLDGKPKVRPFGFMLEEGGRLYFCTSNKKDVYDQMKNQPYVEICVSTPDFSWMRLSGKAIFSNDMVLKTRIIEGNNLVKSIYQSADNPIFEMFYLDEAKAVIADFSGNPPREYTL